MADLAVNLASLELRSPVLSASGTFGHGLEMQHISPPAQLGALVSKTVTREPRPGNPAPRIFETEAGFLNSIGLENRGIDAYFAHTLPEVAAADCAIITNIGGAREEDFVELARMLNECPEVDALELNLSCPNVQGGKLPFGTEPRIAESVLRAVRDVTDKPLFAKLSPNVTRISEMARAVEAGGADGVTAVNTLLGMAVDWRKRAWRLHTKQGGYSGTGIKPVALRCAWECAQAVDLPVIGCGGIACAEDVLEYLAVGCTAIQVGTASFSDPGLLGRLAGEISELLDEAGFGSVYDVIGSMDHPQPAGV